MTDHPLIHQFEDIVKFLHKRMRKTFTEHETILKKDLEEDSQHINRHFSHIILDLDIFSAYVFVLSDINEWGEQSETHADSLVECYQSLQASVTDFREVMRLVNEEDMSRVKRYDESAFRRIDNTCKKLGQGWTGVYIV